MTDLIPIRRELLEQLHPYVYGPERVKLQQEVKAILAAPVQDTALASQHKDFGALVARLHEKYPQQSAVPDDYLIVPIRRELLERIIEEHAPGYHDCIDLLGYECEWCELRADLAALPPAPEMVNRDGHNDRVK